MEPRFPKGRFSQGRPCLRANSSPSLALALGQTQACPFNWARTEPCPGNWPVCGCFSATWRHRSEEHTSELQSLRHLVCRLLLEKKNVEKQVRRVTYGGRACGLRSGWS